MSLKLSYEQGARGGDAEKLQLALALLNLVAARAGDPRFFGGGHLLGDHVSQMKFRSPKIRYRSRQRTDSSRMVS